MGCFRASLFLLRIQVVKSGKRIGLFGGSFDPVHCGHMQIAQKSRESCLLDTVYFLPCSCSPLKEARPRATDAQRLEMLYLALQDTPWAVVDDADLGWPPPSWSWRLAEYFKARHPQDSLFWIMGSDQWEDLERWDRWEYLASLVTFIVHCRGAIPAEREGVDAVFVEGFHPASASLIRADFESRRDWLPAPVAGYVAKHRLYSQD